MALPKFVERLIDKAGRFHSRCTVGPQRPSPDSHDDNRAEQKSPSRKVLDTILFASVESTIISRSMHGMAPLVIGVNDADREHGRYIMEVTVSAMSSVSV